MIRIILVLAMLLVTVDAKRHRAIHSPDRKVWITAYSSTRNQTDRTPCIAADMKDICALYRRGAGIVAISRDLRKYYPYGTKVVIEGREYEVHDTMNPRFTNTFDMYFGKDHRKIDRWRNRFVTVRTVSNVARAHKGYRWVRLPQNIKTITIKKGDTAVGIARKYHMTIFQLSLYNHRWFKHRSLRLGSKIYVLSKQRRVSRVVAEAKAHIGAPYRWGATGPRSFDCSGFTRYVMRKVSIYLPRTSNEQYHATRKIPKSQWRSGDLVFFRARHAFAGHVGILIDPKKKTFIQASSGRGTHRVVISSFNSGSYRRRFLSVRRPKKQ